MDKPSIRTWEPRRGIVINIQTVAQKAKKKKAEETHDKKETGAINELSSLLDEGPLHANEANEAFEATEDRPVDPTRIQTDNSENKTLINDIYPTPKHG